MEEPKQSLADIELERMHNGPTQHRTGPPALYAERWELINEASDVRRMAIFGIATMRHAVALEANLSGDCSSPPPADDPAIVEAAERAAMAEAAVSHDHAHLNVMTLVSMFGAVEGMAEGGLGRTPTATSRRSSALA